MKNIYILLTRSDTIVSRAILFCTGADYTHASLAYDGELNSLSSFARRDPRFALPAGLVRENICDGFYALHGGIPCMLLSLTVSDEAHRRIAERVESMLSVREEYGYSLLGLLTCFSGLPWERQRRYFCSQFVASVLTESGAVTLPKPPSLMHPCDFLDLPGARCLYQGPVSGLRWIRNAAPTLMVQ